ncbi:MAG: hypothetical protein R2880_08420 [Deinococcales bacterium]
MTRLKDFGLARSYLERGLAAAHSYQQIQNYAEAAMVVAWFEQILEQLP